MSDETTTDPREKISRRLAQIADPTFETFAKLPDTPDHHFEVAVACILCDRLVTGEDTFPEAHTDDCPWVLARELHPDLIPPADDAESFDEG